MRFKDSFEFRDVCGEKVLIAKGVENIDFGALINLNTTAADIYSTFIGKDFTTEEVVAYITSNYDIDAETATRDVNALLTTLQTNGVII